MEVGLRTAISESVANTTPVGEHLYSYILKTSVAEYGINVGEFLSGSVPPPPEGARFDIPFEGVVHGPKVEGTVKGVDYLHVRADGRMQLHIHGEITTDEGEKISLYADGVGFPDERAKGIFQLCENVTLTTASPEYSWVNKLQVWGRGTFDPLKSEVKIQAHSAWET